MWKIRRFERYSDALEWMDRNRRRYQCEMVFLNDGYGVEYRRLKKVF